MTDDAAGFGTRRVPLETQYFEAYNDPRVHLIDIEEVPIKRITESGVELDSGAHIDLDVLIYATGYDAITGPLSAIDIRGVSGIKLGDTWADGPRTFLGLFAHDFPNMFMVRHQTRLLTSAQSMIILLTLSYRVDHGSSSNVWQHYS